MYTNLIICKSKKGKVVLVDFMVGFDIDKVSRITREAVFKTKSDIDSFLVEKVYLNAQEINTLVAERFLNGSEELKGNLILSMKNFTQYQSIPNKTVLLTEKEGTITIDGSIDIENHNNIEYEFEIEEVVDDVNVQTVTLKEMR